MYLEKDTIKAKVVGSGEWGVGSRCVRTFKQGRLGQQSGTQIYIFMHICLVVGTEI